MNYWSCCRLTKEYEKILKDTPKGVNVYLPSESDMYTWEAVVDGPEDSLYKGILDEENP